MLKIQKKEERSDDFKQVPENQFNPVSYLNYPVLLCIDILYIYYTASHIRNKVIWP